MGTHLRKCDLGVCLRLIYENSRAEAGMIPAMAGFHRALRGPGPLFPSLAGQDVERYLAETNFNYVN